jgi:hypothetical protein
VPERDPVGSTIEGERKMSTHAYAMLVGIGIPICLLFSGSAILFSTEKTLGSFLQLFGSGCLMVVVLSHIAELFHLLPWMRWGVERSVGHYLDFGSAALGVMLFPLGYLLYALKRGSRASPV